MPVAVLPPAVGWRAAPGRERWRGSVQGRCGVSIQLLACPCCRCPQPSSPGVQPHALLSLPGSEAAAAGLCAGQCILKVNGNNVMGAGATEVLEHFQAFRSHREDALVSTRQPEGSGSCSAGQGWGLPSFSGEDQRPHSIWGGASLEGAGPGRWAPLPPTPPELGRDGLGFPSCEMGV